MSRNHDWVVKLSELENQKLNEDCHAFDMNRSEYGRFLLKFSSKLRFLIDELKERREMKK